jgi:hypothetical protein
VEPVKATFSMPGWRQRSAGGVAEAGDHVEHAGRIAGLLGQLAQAQGGERRVLGGLEDHRAAGGQRRRDLPHGHQQREVPRDDGADHAHRLAAGEAEELPVAHQRHRQLHRAAFDLGGPAGHVADEVDGQGHVHVARHGHRLAVVDGFQLGEFLGVGFQQVGQRAAGAPGPPGGGAAIRRFEGLAGGGHGRSMSAASPAGTRQKASPLAGSMTGRVAPEGLHPLAADQHAAGRARKAAVSGCRVMP